MKNSTVIYSRLAIIWRNNNGLIRLFLATKDFRMKVVKEIKRFNYFLSPYQPFPATPKVESYETSPKNKRFSVQNLSKYALNICFNEIYTIYVQNLRMASLS